MPEREGIRGRPPWVTAAFVAASLAASLAPGGPELLEYDRGRVAAGEGWRLVTGQLVHWTARMTFVDLGAVLLLGWWIERRAHRVLAAAVAASLLVVGVGLHVGAPSLGTYRGASGVASALFLLAALTAARRGRGWMRWIGVLAAAAFAAKTVWEAALGRTLVAGPLPDGVQVAPAAHLLGALAAAATFASSELRSALPTRRRPA